MDGLNVMTLNAAQFPWPLGLPHRSERLDKLINQIIKLNPDVIALQEMWNSTARETLRTSLLVLYPYSFSDETPGKFLIGMNSGLMILSHYPIRRTILHHFTVYRGDEHLAKKGVIGVEIQAEDNRFAVFTTHLQAGPGICVWSYIDRNALPTNIISTLQANEIKQTMDEFNSPYPTLLVGDFNVDANVKDVEYQQVMHNLGNPRDTYEGPAEGTSWNNGVQSNSRVDWILARNIIGHSSIRTDIGPDISDHLTVIGTFVSAAEDTESNMFSRPSGYLLQD